MGEDNRIDGKTIAGRWLIQDNVAVEKMIAGGRFHGVTDLPWFEWR
jgi:hypothetical protein